MFIELTHPKGDRLFVRIEAIAGFSKGRESASEIDLGQGAAYHVCETPAEIAALIAAKEREAKFEDRVHAAATEIINGMWSFSGYGGDSPVSNGDSEVRTIGAALEAIQLVRAVHAQLAAEAEARKGGA